MPTSRSPSPLSSSPVPPGPCHHPHPNRPKEPMTATTSYSVDESALTLALDEAHERIQRAEHRLARITCAHIAAAIREDLTDGAPDTPFDAAHVRLIQQQGRTSLSTDGTYWTASGEERRIEPSDLMDILLGLTDQLHGGNAHVWEPLCHQDPTGYRLDLKQAAQLPEEVSQSARVAEIRERLAAASRAPWSAEEIAYNRAGGIISSGDPEAVHTDFAVTDADGIRVVEDAIDHNGCGETETPAEYLAASRANTALISRAPEDIRFLLAYLDHLCGGEDAEALDLRGYCGHCATALYTSATSPDPAPLDGLAACQRRRLPGGRTLQLQHVLRT